uniref:Short-chain dehydrogenase n=1 Tax=Rhizophora mucronata TaxID=61149 RepID=A0A2P2KIY2_RHIMU
MSIFSLVTGRPGPSGFGSASTAEQVTHWIDASNRTVIITGQFYVTPIFYDTAA